MYFAKPMQYFAIIPLPTQTPPLTHLPQLCSPALFLMSGTWQNQAESIQLPKETQIVHFGFLLA